MSIHLVLRMMQKGMFNVEHFDNAASRANDNQFDVTKLGLRQCTLLMMTSDFVAAPECLYVKLQSHVLTEFELPC